MRQLKGLEAKINEELKKLNHDVALYAIGHLVADLTEKYEEFPEIVTYLEKRFFTKKEVVSKDVFPLRPFYNLLRIKGGRNSF